MKESNLFCDDDFALCLPLLFIGIDFRQHLLSTLAHKLCLHNIIYACFRSQFSDQMCLANAQMP